MTLGATLMSPRALITNLKVTEGNLFAFVLLPSLCYCLRWLLTSAWRSTVCKVLTSAQGREGPSRCLSSRACVGAICSSWPWEASAINSLYREGN